MTKDDIVNQIMMKTGIPKRDVKAMVEAMLATMKEAFFNEERIELRGFGVFSTKLRRGKRGKNPRTNEDIYIPEKKTVVFKPSKTIVRILNHKKGGK